MVPRNRHPFVCYFEDNEEEWARLAPLWEEFDRTLEMVMQMEAEAEKQMPAPVQAPTPPELYNIDDWLQWSYDVGAYYPGSQG